MAVIGGGGVDGGGTGISLMVAATSDGRELAGAIGCAAGGAFSRAELCGVGAHGGTGVGGELGGVSGAGPDSVISSRA